MNMPDIESIATAPRYRDRAWPRQVLEPQEIRRRYRGQSVRKASASDPRGVVLPLAWRRWASDKLLGAPEHHTLLRKSLLYWDEIVWPIAEFTNPDDGEDELQRMLGGEAAITPDLRFLESAGILEVEKLNMMVGPGNLSPEFIAQTEGTMFLNRDHWEPGIWALADTTDEFVCPDSEVPVTRAALFRLVDVLPAPRDDVPFQEILEFKLKYADELINLRARLDSLYFQISSSPDAAYQESVALRELDQAIVALNTAAKFSSMQTIRSSVTAVVDVGEHFVAGVELAKQFALPESQQLLAGVGFCALRLFFKEQASPRNIPGPYAYLYSARDKWDLLDQSPQAKR